MNAQDIISEAMEGDRTTKDALEALEDGAWLESIGCTDDDQAAVEEAHDILEKQHQQEIEDGIYDCEHHDYYFVHGPLKIIDDEDHVRNLDDDEEITSALAEATTYGKIGTLEKGDPLTFSFRIGENGPEQIDCEDMNLINLPCWQWKILEDELLSLAWNWWDDYRIARAMKAAKKDNDEDDEE